MSNQTSFSVAKKKLWFKLVAKTKHSFIYPFIYKSYWHYLFSRNKINKKNTTCYYSAMPNRGAGIGHQMANWIAGYWWAKQFKLKYAHLPFSTLKWENFLGFGEHEPTVEALKQSGYKVRRLPLFDENNIDEFELNKKIINSYAGDKIIFIAEQDQPYNNQYGIMKDLQHKFNNAPARTGDKLIYNNADFNIAVHVRRTVVIEGMIIEETDAVKATRWLSNDYYEKILQQVLENIHPSKPVSIYIFSTGKADEFDAFKKYGNVRVCSDMDEYATFLHLIRADLLITSKSSFSYKPALINDAIKICPRNFWHNYPDDPSFILAENDGSFNIKALEIIS